MLLAVKIIYYFWFKLVEIEIYRTLYLKVLMNKRFIIFVTNCTFFQ